MPAPTSSTAFVTADLRPGVQAALAELGVDEVLEALLARGWRPRQLRDRVGAVAVQPSHAQDAAAVLAALRALAAHPSPQEAYDEELRLRAHREERAHEAAHQPASEQDRARWLATIRASLPGRARATVAPPERLRPDCSLCEGQAAYFVRRDVHLCAHCVDLLAAGEIRPERLTGS